MTGAPNNLSSETSSCLKDAEESTWESGASSSQPIASQEGHLKEIADLKHTLEAAKREITSLRAQLLERSPETEKDFKAHRVSPLHLP